MYSMKNEMKIIRIFKDSGRVTSPKKVTPFLKEFINEDREFLIVLGLDCKHNVIFREIAGIGTQSEMIVSPREIFRNAITKSCKAIILAHNHPSGDCTPSEEDKEATKRIKRAGEIIGIELLDHIIIGRDKFFSLEEMKTIN